MDTTQHNMTSTERREAAARLRQAAGMPFAEGWDLGTLVNTALTDGKPAPTTNADLLGALADLIDPTCEDVSEQPRSGFWPAPHFRCSLCGHRHVSVDYVDYCPRCGARVVDEG